MGFRFTYTRHSGRNERRMGIILDTCIWIDVERGIIAPLDVMNYTNEEPVFISPITIAELTFGIEMANDPGIKQRRIAALNRLKKKPFLLIDIETGVIFGSLSAQLKKMNRSSDFRVQDVWIASQAIQAGFKLLTKNIKDFADIPGLDLIVFGD